MEDSTFMGLGLEYFEHLTCLRISKALLKIRAKKKSQIANRLKTIKGNGPFQILSSLKINSYIYIEHRSDFITIRIGPHITRLFT